VHLLVGFHGTCDNIVNLLACCFTTVLVLEQNIDGVCNVTARNAKELPQSKVIALKGENQAHYADDKKREV
jgi:hypothetical protein